MPGQKIIAFFQEGAFGLALNSVGIAPACAALGHRCVFLGNSRFARALETLVGEVVRKTCRVR